MQKKYLHLDYETYSKLDLTKCTTTQYAKHPSCRIRLVSYALVDDPFYALKLQEVSTIIEDDIYQPNEFLSYLFNPDIIKIAHNAAFERIITNFQLGVVPPDQYLCSMSLAGYYGLPMGLGDLSRPEVLGIKEGKLEGGTALINWFGKPSPQGEMRPLTLDDQKSQKYILYNKYDVVAQSQVMSRLPGLLPEKEKKIYVYTQHINDKGVSLDIDFVEKVLIEDEIAVKKHIEEGKTRFGIKNLRSSSEVLSYVRTELNNPNIKSCDKNSVEEFLKLPSISDNFKEFLSLKQQVNKTSIAKYKKSKSCYDAQTGLVYDLIKYYGATRTGRFAGQDLQIHNFAKSDLDDLELIRELVKYGAPGIVSALSDKPRDILSKLVRTILVADPGCTFVIPDYAAIEARMLATLAGVEWKLEVFRTHGKIYEATASQMFSVPLESVSPDERFMGKTAELALGYGGRIGSFKRFGAKKLEKMNKTDDEINRIIDNWRGKNWQIVRFWKLMEDAARSALHNKGLLFKVENTGIAFIQRGMWLCMDLPSGRSLHYYDPKIEHGQYGYGITYFGRDEDSKSKAFGRVRTHGGKLTENVCQALSRDILAENAIIGLSEAGYDVRFHVHDEAPVNIRKEYAEEHKQKICEIMEKPVSWLPEMPLKVEAFISDYYKK